MADLLKNIYSKQFFNNFAEILMEVVPAFDRKKFFKLIYADGWDELELKERMRRITLVLNRFFPSDFGQTAIVIRNIIVKITKKQERESSFEYMFLPDYIEVFGLNDYETSVSLMEYVTQFCSCEFAVRPFIIKYGDRMINQMNQWSLHQNYHVRRIASEGSRPRLPWAIALPDLKQNPNPILPLLDNLKSDPSEYVRRSVANCLNDIAKDNPEIVISIAKQWKGYSKETYALIKHGCRTLLKKGNSEVLKYFGLDDNPNIVVTQFRIERPKIAIGESLEFCFTLQNNGKKTQTVRIEYGIYYLRNNGQHSKKVFKISERMLEPNEKIDIKRRQSFKIITTRKFYVGEQNLSIIINGQEREFIKFELINALKASQ